jgi:TPR repeat protein
MSPLSVLRSFRFVCIFALFAASIASSQVQKSALIDSLKGLETMSIVTIGYTGSASNRESYPVNTLVYPDGKIIYRVESGMVRVEVKQMQSFLIGTKFQISGIDFKEDRLELKLTIPNRDEGRLKMMLGAGWQNQMTNDVVIALISKFLTLPPAPIVHSAAGTAPASSVPSASQVLDKSLPLTAPDSAQRVGVPSNEDGRNRERAPDLRTTSAAPSSPSSDPPGSLPISQPPDIVSQRGAIGISVSKLHNTPPNQYRIVVGAIVEDGPAYRAGIRVGDRIYSVNGKILKDDEESSAAMTALIPGEAVKVGYLRYEGLFEVTYEAVITATEQNKLYLDWDKKRAGDGDAKGEMSLGTRYLTGNGVSKNYADAEAWLRKAANQGEPTAQNDLGALYELGEGVATNAPEAMRWYLKAANQGESTAQNNLGTHYMLGEGVATDAPEAMRWYLKAANQGNAAGEFHAGAAYETGSGVAKDLEQARSWYQKAAQQGQGDAKAGLERLDAVEQSERLAVDRDKKRAGDGDAEGEMALGKRYFTGDGVSKNYAEAEAWLLKAANQGNSTAQNYLGTRYMRGEGVALYPAEAMRWYLKAAGQGDAAGEFNVGYAYENGFGGVATDPQQALSWYRKAAQQGQGDAKAALERLDAAEQSERLAYDAKIQERRLAEEREKRFVDDAFKAHSGIARSLGLHAGQPQAQVKAILAAHGYSGFTGSGPWTCVPNGVVNGEDTVGCASRSDQVAKLIVVFGMAKRYRNPDTTELYGVRTDRLLVAYFEFAESKFFRSATLNFYSAELKKCNGVNNDAGECLNF